MNRSISEKICELRKARKLTQEQLGDRLGVSGQAVSKWETGSSMPDILLLPELCEVLGITIEALLEVPSSVKHKSILPDFCEYASEVGKGTAVVEAIACLFNDSFQNHGGNSALLSQNEIRVSDDRGLGFVLTGNEFKNACIKAPNAEIADFLKVFCDDSSLSVIKMMSAKAVTKEELLEATGLDDTALSVILLELMNRNIICAGTDSNGKRGYLHSVNMICVLMILSACKLSGCGGGGFGSVWQSWNLD